VRSRGLLSSIFVCCPETGQRPTLVDIGRHWSTLVDIGGQFFSFVFPAIFRSIALCVTYPHVVSRKPLYAIRLIIRGCPDAPDLIFVFSSFSACRSQQHLSCGQILPPRHSAFLTKPLYGYLRRSPTGKLIFFCMQPPVQQPPKFQSPYANGGRIVYAPVAVVAQTNVRVYFTHLLVCRSFG
jgi:hypothetical protein